MQRDVYHKLGMVQGMYDHFAIMVENVYLEPPLMLLEDYGIPIGTITLLERYLSGSDTLDEALRRIKLLKVNTLECSDFEKGLIEEARKYL